MVPVKDYGKVLAAALVLQLIIVKTGNMQNIRVRVKNYVEKKASQLHVPTQL
jgi:hypothetical protein